MHGTQRGDIVREDKQDTGTCKVLLILEWLSERARKRSCLWILFVPAPAASGFLQWQGSRAEAELLQNSPGAGPGWGSDLGCGRVPPLAAASNVTEPRSGCRSSSSPNHSLGGAAQCSGGQEQLPGLQEPQGEGNGPALLRGGMGQGLLACAARQVHVSHRDGEFLHFHCTIFRAPQIKESCGALNVS